MKVILILIVFLISVASGKEKPNPIYIYHTKDRHYLIHLLEETELKGLKKLKDSVLLNIEPGCMIVEAFLTQLPENKFLIQMPFERSWEKRFLKMTQTQTENLVISFKPPTKPNHAAKILSAKDATPEQLAKGYQPLLNGSLDKKLVEIKAADARKAAELFKKLKKKKDKAQTERFQNPDTEAK